MSISEGMKYFQTVYLKIIVRPPAAFNLSKKKFQMISSKYLIFLTLIELIYYNGNKIESQKGIDIIYQLKLLLVEKFVNIQILVPFPRLNASLGNQFFGYF